MPISRNLRLPNASRTTDQGTPWPGDSGFRRFAGRLVGMMAASLLLHASFAFSLIVPQTDTHPDSVIRQAKRDLDRRDYGKVEQELEALLLAEPNSPPDAYVMLAVARASLHENERALESCEMGLQRYPRSTQLGGAYMTLLTQSLPGTIARSRARTQATLNPASAVLQKVLGELLLADDAKNPEAEELLRQAAAALPQDAEAHFFFGKAECFNNHFEACISQLKKALTLDARNLDASVQIYTMIALAEDKLEHPVQATAAYRKAMAINEKLPVPDNLAAFEYVTYMSRVGKRSEVWRVTGEILARDPAYGPAHFERAKSLAYDKKLAAAIDEANLALQDSRCSPEELRRFHAFLAKTNFALGRASEAQVHQDWVESHQVAEPQP